LLRIKPLRLFVATLVERKRPSLSGHDDLTLLIFLAVPLWLCICISDFYEYNCKKVKLHFSIKTQNQLFYKNKIAILALNAVLIL
jgi:hypothetical protein